MALHSLVQFYEEAQPYVALFNDFARNHILYDHARADHICYKCETRGIFEYSRRLFEGDAREWSFEEQISGRAVAYIKLAQPIPTVLGPIEYLELADQKPDGSQEAGFAHIEAYPLGQSYEELVRQLESVNRATESGHEHHPTHDFQIRHDLSFLFRCAREPLVQKIVRERMLTHKPAAF